MPRLGGLRLLSIWSDVGSGFYWGAWRLHYLLHDDHQFDRALG